MFESAVITRAGLQKEVDIGLLAETIFFYQSVHIVLNHSAIVSLAKQIPIDDLIALLNRTQIKLSYVRPNFGVISQGAPRAHQFSAFTFHSDPQKRRPKNYKEETELFLERSLGRNAKTRKLIKAIEARTVLHKFKETPEKENIIPNLARQDISDKEFTQNAARVILKNLTPEFTLPTNFRFEAIDTGQGYVVDTNIDYLKVNEIYHKTTPPSHSTIASEYILSHIISARLDSYFAASYMAELVTIPVYSDLIRLKHFDFTKRRQTNEEQIIAFKDAVLHDMPTLREAINGNSATISDFLKLLDQAERFRDWLKNTNPDIGLVANYHKAATEKTWADRLPTKSVRFMMSSGLGVMADVVMPTGLGTATGLAVGAADTFLLDRLIKGWRPSQFIEGPYRGLLKGE